MPIYEFYSPDTHKIYSFYARSLAQGRVTPICPDRPKARMERLISPFAVTGRATETQSSEPTDPRMEQAMAQVESQMAGMSSENPDPRAIARMMRTMTEATGQKMPAEMKEMIARLEKGENPEKLEEEFGSAMENLDMPEENPSDDKSPRPRKTQPQRDPKLYEMADFTKAPRRPPA